MVGDKSPNNLGPQDVNFPKTATNIMPEREVLPMETEVAGMVVVVAEVVLEEVVVASRTSSCSSRDSKTEEISSPLFYLIQVALTNSWLVLCTCTTKKQYMVSTMTISAVIRPLA
jgi:hypothetical protein